MRYLLFLLLAVMVNMNVSFAQKSKFNEYVEVLYFHGKQRCATCRAIETNTKNVIYKNFAKELKQGKVKYRVIDISTPEGERMADAYKVSWSSLFVNKWKNGKETRMDLTQMGFKNARTNSAEFSKQLEKTVTELLK